MRTRTTRVGRNVIIDGRCYVAEQSRRAAGMLFSHRPSAWGKTRAEAIDKLAEIVETRYGDTQAASCVVVTKLIEEAT